MSIWHMGELAAWVVSALILVFLVGDAIRVSMKYDEEYLTHSLEDPFEELDIDSHGRVAVDRHVDAHGDPREADHG